MTHRFFDERMYGRIKYIESPSNLNQRVHDKGRKQRHLWTSVNNSLKHLSRWQAHWSRQMGISQWTKEQTKVGVTVKSTVST